MKRLLVIVALALGAGSAGAQDMDRKTCFAMAKGYGYLYEALKAGKPRAEVESHLVQMGVAAGIDREQAATLVAQSVGLAYIMPSLMTATPREALDKAQTRCPHYPETLASR